MPIPPLVNSQFDPGGPLTVAENPSLLHREEFSSISDAGLQLRHQPPICYNRNLYMVNFV